jgi:cyclophilin family peptidyl-prolyl cis-trans isomerase
MHSGFLDFENRPSTLDWNIPWRRDQYCFVTLIQQISGFLDIGPRHSNIRMCFAGALQNQPVRFTLYYYYYYYLMMSPMRLLLLLLLLLLTTSCCYSKEEENIVVNIIPDHMAPRPDMDPIPMLPQVTHKVFLEIDDNGNGNDDSSGRIVLGLFGNHAPKLVQNFKALCACDTTDTTDKLCYKGSTFHRIISNFMIQGGLGKDTIFGGGQDDDIEDENFSSSSSGAAAAAAAAVMVKHNRPFLLSSANRGRRNSNTSQFFITTTKAQWLDGKHVIFGVVLEGEDVIRSIQNNHGTHGGTPRPNTVTIVDTGLLELTHDDLIPIPVARRQKANNDRTTKRRTTTTTESTTTTTTTTTPTPTQE